MESRPTDDGAIVRSCGRAVVRSGQLWFGCALLGCEEESVTTRDSASLSVPSPKLHSVGDEDVQRETTRRQDGGRWTVRLRCVPVVVMEMKMRVWMLEWAGGETRKRKGGEDEREMAGSTSTVELRRANSPFPLKWG